VEDYAKWYFSTSTKDSVVNAAFRQRQHFSGAADAAAPVSVGDGVIGRDSPAWGGAVLVGTGEGASLAIESELGVSEARDPSSPPKVGNNDLVGYIVLVGNRDAVGANVVDVGNALRVGFSVLLLDRRRRKDVRTGYRRVSS